MDNVIGISDYQRVVVLRHGLEYGGKARVAGATLLVPCDQAKILALSGAVDFADAELAANDSK